MWNFTKKRLGDVLLESGTITQAQLEEALSSQKASGMKLGELLVSKGYVTKKKIIQVLESQLNIPYIELVSLNLDSNVVHLVPENLAKKHEVLAIKFENNILTVVASDPLNVVAFDDIRIFTGYDIQPAIGDSDQIKALISRFYSSQKALEAVQEFTRTNSIYMRDIANLQSEQNNTQALNDSPAVRLINILIEQAFHSGASDIHIEPQNATLRIRFRVDGQLQDIMKSEIEIFPALVSRIKVMSGLNIAEKRLPQDGRTTYKTGSEEVDLRISILPSIHGEKVVIRLISKNTFNIPKENLGFLPENLSMLSSILRNPHGIILVTGPTGSGKTTTLYTAIKELNSQSVNIVTVEDPVESIIPGITQVQVNTGAGLDFANSLRSILRQDPNIILIGEIRDAETAEIAVRSAITGHLVLSTLHTNDASSSIARLIDMGIQPFLVSTSLVGIIAQRLVRKICYNCRTPYSPSVEEIQLFGSNLPEGAVFYKGTGCEVCNGTGYKGRTSVHEVMRIGAELRSAIYKGESSDQLNDIAIKNGMIPLRDNCKRIVLDGVTTLKEMLMIVYTQE